MKLTIDEINALDGTAINEAVARAAGWYSKLYPSLKKEKDPPIFWAKEGVPGIRDNVPDYRSGDLIDRLAREISHTIQYFDDDGFTIGFVKTKNSFYYFQSESLTTAILRAWLWYMQEVK